MRVNDLKVGDRLENYRTGAVYVVVELVPCGSYSCGNGEIRFDERQTLSGIVPREITTRHRSMTFRQFERLKFIRRESDRVS